MPQSYRGRFLSTQRNNERAMQSLFRQLAASIASEVTRRAEGDGTVPRSATFEIQQAAGEKITNFFLGYNRQGKRAPFDVLPGGAVFPVSPFMRQLWSAISAAVRIPVEQNAAILYRRLPADVLLVMRQAKVDPLAAGKAAVAEQIFRPNPLAQYDAPHQWVDPNGYQLSDRVWNTTAHTRQQIDRYLDVAIREGRGALRMSRELEQFLIPGQQLRTKAPYGTDASFDAMRLARTEITRAHLEASRTSAAMNPFVAGLKWNLSARHPRIDICDSYARGGPNGDGVYPIESYPGIPHPQCVTPGQLVNTRRGSIPIEQVKAGDMVLTHKGRYRRVTTAWATPHDGPVYKMETEQGTFELTGNHPVLLRSGWINAESVQLGDEVLRTGGSASPDLNVGKVNETPALACNKGLALSEKGIGLFAVPVGPVALDTNHDLRHGNVYEVATNAHFFAIEDTLIVEGDVHSHLRTRWAKETGLSVAEQHGHESGVIDPFGFGDFAGDFGATSRIIVTSKIKPGDSLAQFLPSGAAPTSVVFLPTSSDGIALVSHGDIAEGQQVAQNAVRNTILGKDLGTRQALIDVDGMEQFVDGATVFGFESASMKGCTADTMELVVALEVNQGRAADGASNHYSLLSLSPDDRGGAESGNSVVNGVITPIQAPSYYSMIQGIAQRHYTGLVYNMEVEEDHSYTVNGAAVHNCLCYSTNALVGDPDEILDELRKDIRRERALLVDKVGPVEVDRFTALLLGQTPAGVVPPVSVTAPPITVVPPAVVPPVVTGPTPAEIEAARLKAAAEAEAKRLQAEQAAREAEARARAAAEAIAKAVAPPPIAPAPLPEPALIELDYRPRQKDLDVVAYNIDRRVGIAARRLRVAPAEVEKGAEAALRELGASKPIAINIHTEHIDSILNDGRLKTQFETNSSGGVLDREARETAEYAGLGAPLGLDPKRRPIYGYLYLNAPQQKLSMSQYGDITFILKDEVKNRSTITTGDSLENFHTGNVAATPVRAPGRHSFDNEVEALYKYAQDHDEIALRSEVFYLEIQTQKGVSVKDIARVLDHDGKLSPAQIARLRAQGIEVESGKPAEESPALQASAGKKAVTPGEEPLSVSAVKPSKKGAFDPDNPADVRRQIAELNSQYAPRLLELTQANDKLFIEFATADGRVYSAQKAVDRAASGTPEHATATAALDQHKATLADISKRMNAVQAERDQLRAERGGKVAPLINARNPANVKIDAQGADPSDVRRWQSGVDIFNRLVDAKAFYHDGAVKFAKFDGRANYSPERKTVLVGAGTSPTTVAHELGHWLEDISPTAQKKVVAFFNRRTAGETREQLPGQPPGEVGKKDNFLDSYMGREYVTPAGKRLGSEIISMGIQYMQDDPVLFATRDPDYFDFMFNLLRGR